MINRLLIVLLSLFIANTALADYQISSGGKTYTASTQDAVCQQYYNYIKSVVTRITTYSVSGGYCMPVDPSGNGGYNSAITQVTVESKCSDGPGVYNGNTINVQWQQNTPVPTKTCIPHGGGFCAFITSDIYVNLSQSGSVAYTSSTATLISPTPVSQCSNQYDGACDPKDPYGKCYTPPNDGCTRQSNGSIVCPPDTPAPSPEPTCRYSTSGAYCTPQNGQCPSGYVTGNYNGQTICVKDSKNPPPTDPNNQQGDGSCNGTGNCSPNSNNTTTNNHTTNNTTNQTTQNTTNNNTTNNTTNNEITQELDDSGIIAAINSTSATIVQTITSKSDAIKSAVDAVKNTADSILDKLGIVDKSIKDAAQQAKTDAEKQRAQDKAYQDWQKLTQKCVGAKPPLTRDSFSNTNEASDFVNNTTTPTGNPSDVNMKLCKFADSFEEYKDWMQGKGEGNGIPEGAPDGKLAVEQTGLGGEITTSKLDGNYVQFSASCPADLTIAINVIKAGNITLSYQPFCQLASMLRPFIIAISYLSAAFIILGIGKGD